ncbi:MAG: nickel pincer cofactor biosynthesis protein LarB [Dehalococcoidia bacterium]|nr:nickel pincer cofactor biosynthesis protein LarB [Dehalococcoidia bacterium]
MEPARIRQLLEDVAAGRVDPAGAYERLRLLPYEDIGFAKIDHHRSLRDGMPEVVLGEGKTIEQIVAIAERLAERSDRMLITRTGPEAYAAVAGRVPGVTYHAAARCISLNRSPGALLPGIVIVAGGTADLSVVEEAALTAELIGHASERIIDVGVAGIHRLLAHLPQLQAATVVIAIAGMDGALASAVGGLVAGPVIAVPTSVGYGAAFGGLAPLLTMLNSCATGVAVVNIDNGFGAGYLAARINTLAHQRPD